MYTRAMRAGWLLIPALAALAASACESGTEIAGVAQASAARTSDGSIVVTATLDCMLVRGLPRADGHCDADNTRVCIEARWFKRLDPLPTSHSPGQLTGAQICRKIANVRGETMQITMRPGSVPADAAVIVVFSADQQTAKQAPHEIVIASP